MSVRDPWRGEGEVLKWCFGTFTEICRLVEEESSSTLPSSGQPDPGFLSGREGG